MSPVECRGEALVESMETKSTIKSFCLNITTCIFLTSQAVILHSERLYQAHKVKGAYGSPALQPVRQTG